MENHCLRRQLDDLLSEARLNESKMRRFDQLERQLIGAASLSDLIRILLSEYQTEFAVEFVTLRLVDPEYETTRILEADADQAPATGALTLLPSAAALESLYGRECQARLEAFAPARHQPLFAAPVDAIACVALLPLMRQGQLIGSLNFGSADPGRYVAGCGTDFLDRLATIVAICLEAALARERLKQVGLTDGLTAVQNRRYFDHRLQIETSLARRHKRALACMLLDVDKFKRINDSHGHQTGDEVLRTIARQIQSQLRVGDTIARYGGEEFVVLLPRTAGRHAGEIAERIRIAIAATKIPLASGEEISVTISIGLSVLPIDGLLGENANHAEWLVAAADKALYRAKHSGRNRVVHDETIQVEPTASALAWLLDWPQRMWVRLRNGLSDLVAATSAWLTRPKLTPIPIRRER